METAAATKANETEIDEQSLDCRQRRVGGGFWNEWRTVGNEKSESVSGDEGEEKGHGVSSSPVSASVTDNVTHCPAVGPNSGQNNRQQIEPLPIGSLDDDGANDGPPSDGNSEHSLPHFRQTVRSASSPSSSAPSSSSSSNAISSSPKSSGTAPAESDGQVPSPNSDSSASSAEMSFLALSQNQQKNLRLFINAIGRSKLAPPIALEDKLRVLDWLGELAESANIAGEQEDKSPSPSMSASCSDFPESQERLQNLQMTRDSLSLQVASLSRQVALQREKIHNLEESLGRKTNGKQYQHQGRKEAAGGGGGGGALGQQPKESGEQSAELWHKHLPLEGEKTEAERNLQPNGETEQKEAKIDEVERLQKAVQRLMADNEQKNSLIKTLHNALEEQQRRLLSASLTQQPNEGSVHQWDINEQIRRILLTDDLSLDGCSDHSMAHSSSFPAGLCAHSFRAASPRRTPQPFLPPSSAPTSARQQCFPVSASFSSSLSHLQATAMIPPPPLWRVSSPPPPSIPPHRLATDSHPQAQSKQPTSSSGPAPTSPLARQLAAELDELRQSEAMGVLLRQPYSSASLPRTIHSKANSFNACAATRLRHAVESDDELLAASSARGSVPNSEALNGHSPPCANHLKRGRRTRSTLRSFLGRFAHRGNSLQDVRPQRLSASLLPPGVPSSSCASVRPLLCHFVDWDRAHCARWLTEVGFGDAFVGAVRSGRHLLSMAETNFEQLGIRSALQRKRLRSMLDRIERNTETEAADKMDTNLVMLWLDQIGLPQLRDIFAENRIDGQLLLVLSVNDLIELGVHSALSHASLARAIQFLRSVDFHLHRLEKHFSSEFLTRCPIPAEVERWSHCCTVEWLRSEDLEEFTPNLAFSGLHGALMVYEPTFTAESLAEMLQIPSSKSLIRRHLTTQFNTLLGQQLVGIKRDTVAQPMVTHLTPGLRIRLAKRGFSLGRKKSKSDIFVEPEVRICPEEERNGEKTKCRIGQLEQMKCAECSC